MIIPFQEGAISPLMSVIKEFSNLQVVPGHDETAKTPDPGKIDVAKQRLQDIPGASLFLQMPCDVWNRPANACTYAEAQGAVEQCLQLLGEVISIAEICLRQGGHMFFIWPRGCAGWLRRELIFFIDTFQLHTVEIGTFRMVTSSKSAVKGLQRLTSSGGPHEIVEHQHFRTILSAAFGEHARAPPLPCGKVTGQPHREKDEQFQRGIQPIAAMVTKLLDRAETRSNPQAIEAVQCEAQALIDADTWSEDTVIEKDQLIAEAKSSGETIHMGDLMTICSVKNSEGPADLAGAAYSDRRHKRILENGALKG